jgi:hypothetical protein
MKQGTKSYNNKRAAAILFISLMMKSLAQILLFLLSYCDLGFLTEL